MCYSSRIARNNGIKPHGFRPRAEKVSQNVVRLDQRTIVRNRMETLRQKNPGRYWELVLEEKKVNDKRLNKAEEEFLENQLAKQRRKHGGMP